MDEESAEYMTQNISPTLTAGLAELCRVKPEDPVTWLALYLQANKPPPKAEAAVQRVSEAELEEAASIIQAAVAMVQ